jgi:hypothetical protein
LLFEVGGGHTLTKFEPDRYLATASNDAVVRLSPALLEEFFKNMKTHKLVNFSQADESKIAEFTTPFGRDKLLHTLRS